MPPSKFPVKFQIIVDRTPPIYGIDVAASSLESIKFNNRVHIIAIDARRGSTNFSLFLCRS